MVARQVRGVRARHQLDREQVDLLVTQALREFKVVLVAIFISTRIKIARNDPKMVLSAGFFPSQ